jgi:lipopolysaccharide transport system ATP-binding protein
MLVRLAFAVQTRVEPDILIVDEALSVGDEKFQRKCYQRFEELLSQGTTILLVTHATVVVERFCSRAILLDGGRLAAIGPAKEVIDKYHQLLYGQKVVSVPPPNAAEGVAEADVVIPRVDSLNHDSFLQSRLGRAATVPRKGGLAAQIDDVWMRKAGGGDEEPYYETGESIEIGMIVSAAEDLPYLQAGMNIRTTEGVSVYGTSSLYWGKSLERVSSGSHCLFRIQVELNLCPGTYFVSFAIADMSLSGEMNYYDKSSDSLMFRVHQHPLLASGIVALRPEMSFELL